MRKAVLSNWVKTQTGSGMSRRKFANRIGVTNTAIQKWEERSVKRLSPTAIELVAKYKGESYKETCDWLGIEIEDESTPTYLSRLEELERQMSQVQQLLAKAA